MDKILGKPLSKTQYSSAAAQTTASRAVLIKLNIMILVKEDLLQACNIRAERRRGNKMMMIRWFNKTLTYWWDKEHVLKGRRTSHKIIWVYNNSGLRPVDPVRSGPVRSGPVPVVNQSVLRPGLVAACQKVPIMPHFQSKSTTEGRWKSESCQPVTDTSGGSGSYTHTHTHTHTCPAPGPSSEPRFCLWSAVAGSRLDRAAGWTVHAPDVGPRVYKPRSDRDVTLGPAPVQGPEPFYLSSEQHTVCYYLPVIKQAKYKVHSLAYLFMHLLHWDSGNINLTVKFLKEWIKTHEFLLLGFMRWSST